MDSRTIAVLHPLLNNLQLEDPTGPETETEKKTPIRRYFRNVRAMADTPADVIELPSSYVFAVDMPGVRLGQVKVKVKDGSLLVVTGKRRRGSKREEEEKRYFRKERRMGKFMRRFSLPEDADRDGISAVYQDGVVTVTVKKLPELPEKKTVEVDIA